MAMSAPYITHPVTWEGWWTCCGNGKGCGREVNSKLFQNTCPDCGHEKCESCGLVERPSPVPEDYSRQHHHANGFPHEMNTPSHQGYGYQYSYHQHHANHYNPVEYSRRPSMRGWWHCCQCGADNNPAVNDWTCPVDYHDKCENCYVYP